MTQNKIPSLMDETDLGWSESFAAQITEEDAGATPLRVCAVQRKTARGLDQNGEHPLVFPPEISAAHLAVGDWVLADPETHRILRILDRRTILSRRAAGVEIRPQLLAANIDTLFITTACNTDFNPARIERYVILALDAGVTPVLILTKTDLAEDPESYIKIARGVSDKIAEVIAINAKDDSERSKLLPYCGPGQTVAFAGSSGVGKSTLINALTDADQATASVRRGETKGRHTTTSRSLHRMQGGGMVVDMPGMRELGLHDVSGGIEALFEDITDLAAQCKFRDCAHESEPGCALQAAIKAGTLDADRVDRWHKLRSEEELNTASMGLTRREARLLARGDKAAQAKARNLRR